MSAVTPLVLLETLNFYWLQKHILLHKLFGEID